MIEFIKSIFHFGHDNITSIDYRELSVQTSKQEIKAGIKDKNGFVYSKDGLRLLKGHSFIDKAKIKSSVLVICDNAFEYCFVENIQFPRNLKRIGARAFSNARCKGHFVLPESLETIDSEAFANFTDESCDSDVNFIPESVRDLGSGVFINSNIKRPIILNSYSITIPKEMFKNGTFSLIKISDSTKHIEEHAFEKSRISKVLNLPNCIKEIDDCAFEESSTIEELDIKCLKHLGSRCFYNNKRLKKITLYKDICSIDNDVFANCSCVHSLNLRESSIKSIPNGMFEGCVRLKSVDFPRQLISIGAKAFKGTSMPKLDLSEYDSLTSILEEAFSHSSLENISLNENIKEIGKEAFSDCNRLKVYSCPNPKCEYGEKCFYNCKELENVIGEINISAIPDFMFWLCRKLKNVKLGDNVRIIGQLAFSNCESLENFYLPKSLKEIHRLAFCSCKRINIELPEGIEEIDSQAFGWDWQLKSIVIPSSVNVITGNPFCGIKTKIINNSPNFILKDNVLFNKDMSRLIYFNKVCEEYILPESVKVIGNNAFSYNWNLKKVYLPSSLRKIESSAFYECKSLSSINLNEDIDIEDEAFVGCRLLKKYGLETDYPVTDADIIDAYYDSMIDYDIF